MFDIESLEPGTGIEFANKTVGGSVPKEYVKAVEQGMREAAGCGIITAYPSPRLPTANCQLPTVN